MKRGWIVIAVVVLLVLVLFSWWKNSYNNFVQADENVKAQLGQLNNVYQQRADLIPNLVNTVQGAAAAERQTLTEVIQARAQATSIQLTPEALKDTVAFQNFQRAQGNLEGALSRLMAVAEQYPNLKSQENFTVLMSQLEGQENRIRVERNRYNEVVNDYNRRIRTFPSSIIAGMSGFTQYPYFQAAAGSENAPRVNFPSGDASSTAPGTSGTTTAPSTGAAPNPKSTPHGAVQPAPAH